MITHKPGGARPFLKWVGGKTQLLPELLKRAPKSYFAYREPFLGGGAMFFAQAQAWQHKGGAPSILSDINPRLIRTYTAVRDNVEDVILQLKDHAEEFAAGGADYFYKVRGYSGCDAMSDFGIAAWMIFLNKTCFNGLYRVNKAGMFNVPVGRYKNPTICDVENLRACSRVLQEQHTTLMCAPYVKAVAGAGELDFIYMDPPYAPVSETANFTAYSAGGFGEAEQVKLAEDMAALKARGVTVMLSNAGTEGVRWLYESHGLKVEAVSARRSINSVGSKRGNVQEFIVT